MFCCIAVGGAETLGKPCCARLPPPTYASAQLRTLCVDHSLHIGCIVGTGRAVSANVVFQLSAELLSQQQICLELE